MLDLIIIYEISVVLSRNCDDADESALVYNFAESFFSLLSIEDRLRQRRVNVGVNVDVGVDVVDICDATSTKRRTITGQRKNLLLKIVFFEKCDLNVTYL